MCSFSEWYSYYNVSTFLLGIAPGAFSGAGVVHDVILGLLIGAVEVDIAVGDCAHNDGLCHREGVGDLGIGLYPRQQDADGDIHRQHDAVLGLVDPGLGKLIFKAGGGAAHKLHPDADTGPAASQQRHTAEGAEGDGQLCGGYLRHAGEHVGDDLGLYADIILQREFIRGPGQAQFQKLARQGGICRTLAEQDWRGFYLKDVPLSMLIYDFQRRYKTIPHETVFSVWHGIYKRIDYANGMWSLPVLREVFQYAPPPRLPALEPDGLITIYRGMGALSLPPEQAISWTTHPGNALWFAIHSGQGTKVAVARVRPEQIVAHYPSYAEENEVVIFPGTVTEYRYEDMIPAVVETVPRLMAPALQAYLDFGRQARALGYQQEKLFQLHGLLHVLRVLFLTLIYFYNSGDPLTESDRQILIYFSLLHDLGRLNENVDAAHGERSVELIHKRGIRLRGIRLSRKEYRIAELIIAHHCRDDGEGIAAITAEPGLSRKEKEHAIHLYHICKDMDALDRVRFNGLDYRMLRTQYARRLPLVAGCLLEEDLLTPLDMEFPAK